MGQGGIFEESGVGPGKRSVDVKSRAILTGYVSFPSSSIGRTIPQPSSSSQLSHTPSRVKAMIERSGEALLATITIDLAS